MCEGFVTCVSVSLQMQIIPPSLSCSLGKREYKHQLKSQVVLRSQVGKLERISINLAQAMLQLFSQQQAQCYQRKTLTTFYSNQLELRCLIISLERIRNSLNSSLPQ